tara:strand:+ start:626 stop:3268 length:2643 start_codon:yes stop_codon:yes gene_type:complete
MDYETEQDNLYIIGSLLRSKPVEEPTVTSDSGEADTQGQSFIDKTLSNVSSVGSDVGKAIVKGVPKGAEETLYGAAELVGAPVDTLNWVMSKVPGVGQYISSDMPIGGSDSIKYVLDAYNNFVNDNIPGVKTANTWVENLQYDNEMLGGITEGVAQFSVAAVPAATMVKALTSANAFVRGLYWGAIADYAAFNPNDPTLTVSLTKMWDGATPAERTNIGNTVVSILEKNENNPEIINRAKSAIEGGILGGATEGVIKAIMLGAKYVPWKPVAGATAGSVAMSTQDAEANFLKPIVKGALKSGDDVVDNVVDSTMVILPKQVNKGSDMVLEYPSLFHGTTKKGLDYLDINKSRRTQFGAIPAINATNNKKLASAFTRGELGKDPEGEIYKLKGSFKILNLKNNEGRTLWEQTYNRDPQKALADGYDGIQFQQLENDRIEAFYKDINVDDVEDAVEIQLFKPRIEIEKITDTSLKLGDDVVGDVVLPNAKQVLDDTKTVLDARAKQMELSPKDRVQPSGQNPLFDTSPKSYEKTLVSHKQKEIVLPRNNGEVATLPIRDRARAVLDNTDAIAQEIANSIKPAIGSNVQYFYHTAPLIDKAVALGIPEKVAKKQLFKFAQNYAVTSPRTRTEENLRSASLVSAKETLGKDVTEILGSGGDGINEKGYPMMINEGGIHKKLIEDKQAGKLNVNTNPKPVSFAENVSGNLKVVTVDTHAIRAVFYVMNKLNPGSVPIDFIGGKKPKKTKEFQEMYKKDPSSLDVATMIKDTLAKQMINGKSMQTEYAVFADIYKKVAEIAGVNPAEAQSLTWFTFGDLTGLGSEPKTIVDLIDDRVDVTSQLTGQSKEEVFKKFMQGAIPLASFDGLNLLDTGAEIGLDASTIVA